MKRLFLLVVAFYCLGPARAQWTDPLVREGRTLNEQNRYQEALEHFVNALATVEPVRDQKPGLYTILTLEKGVALSGRDQLDEALKTYLKAEKMAADLWGIHSRNYRAVSDRLLQCYKALGQNENAAELLQARLDLPADIQGTKDDFRLQDLRSLAQLYDRRLRNPRKAQEYERQVLEMTRELRGENHPDYWQSLFDLGRRQAALGDMQTGIATLEKARDLAKQIFTATDNRLLINIRALEKAYRKVGQSEKAEGLREGTEWKDPFAIPDRPASMEPYDLYLHIQKLLFMDRFQEAKETLKLGINHIEAQYSILNPYYNLFLYDLSNIYFSEREYQSAYKTLEKANKSLDERVQQNLGVLSEQEKGNFIHKLSTFYNNILFRAFTFGDVLPGLHGLAYNNSLNLKGILLSSSRTTMETIKDNADPEVLRKYRIWQAAKKQLAEAYTKPISERDAITASLEKWVERLESDLILASSDFQTNAERFNWEEVRDALEPGEAALEFVSMDLYDPKKQRSAYYYALVLTADSEYPTMVRLCPEQELRALLENEQTVDRTFVQNLYGSFQPSQASRGLGIRIINTEAEPEAVGGKLYDLIWKPLEPVLGGIQTVFYSPAGLLHRIAFQALSSGSGEYLIDGYRLHQLSSTWQLIDKKQEPVVPPTAASLFGGVIYNPGEDWSVPVEGASFPAGESLDTSLLANNRGAGSWSFLAGTEREISQLQSLLTAKGVTVQSFSGLQASEDRLKTDIESGAARGVLHLATHGFFFPDPEFKKRDNSVSFKSAENPLIRSGLLLAGANYVWGGNPAPVGRDDGVLTAYEIADLDLRDIQLAVLSACETGLGDIRGSEGVYGLQRAFKMAGVDQLIISLWQVPDEETVELMEILYSEWLAGKPISEALHLAQLELRDKYDPYFWAAFVLIE